MSADLDPRQLRRRFLLLRGLRWLPTGLLAPVFVLLFTSRGLSLTEIGLVTAVQGLFVLLLELPTGGLADTIGRRQVLLLATGFDVLSLVVLATTGEVLLLPAAFALQGVYRALESGPLNAWFVDASLAADPNADIERGLGAGGAVSGVAMAVGSLGAGAIVALEPLGAELSLVAPILVAIVLRVVEFVALLRLVVEPPRTAPRGGMRTATAGVAATVRDALRAVRGSVALLALVASELIWGLTAAAYELLPPVRLEALTGSADRAAALMGPASAAAWLAVAAGSALAPRLSRRWGTATSAGVTKLLHAVAVIAMGMATGPAGVLLAYVVTFGAHGATSVPWETLMHREADAANRTTVLSTASMVGLGTGALGGILLGALADATTPVTAMIVGGVVLATSAPLFVLVHRHGRPAPTTARTVSG